MTRGVVVCVWYISCFLFCELPATGLCLSLILGSSQPLLLQNISFFPLVFQSCICYIFWYCPTILGCLFSLFHSFYLQFSLGNFYWSIFMFFYYFLSYVKSTDELLRLTLFLLHCCCFLKFPFNNFLEPPYLLHYSSIFWHSLHFQLEPLMYLL